MAIFSISGALQQIPVRNKANAVGFPMPVYHRFVKKLEFKAKSAQCRWIFPKILLALVNCYKS
jgi:hypothetical protein